MSERRMMNKELLIEEFEMTKKNAIEIKEDMSILIENIGLFIERIKEELPK